MVATPRKRGGRAGEGSVVSAAGRDQDFPGQAGCRLVIVEFPTMERLQAWYASADYATALAVRQTALDRRLLFVDGENMSSGLR